MDRVELVGIVLTSLVGASTWGRKGASSRGSRRNAASRTRTWSPLATGLILVSRVDYLVLVLIVIDMVFKPGLT